MITEITLLKLFVNSRASLAQYGSYVKYDSLSDEIKVILQDIDLYYEEFENHESIDMEQFALWFHQIRHPDITETSHKVYKIIFERLASEEIQDDGEFTKTVVNHFKQQVVKEKVRHLLDGPGLELGMIKDELKEYEETMIFSSGDDFSANNFDDIFVKTTRAKGLRWRLPCLNRSIGPLVAGDFGYVAAYVDTGKSKFLISEAAYMAQQITEGSVLWFNNEGPEDRVQSQLWCAVLETDNETIIGNDVLAREKYIEKMHGDIDRVKIFDAVGMSPRSIREKAEKYDARLIIIDMLDHIQLPGGDKNQEVIRLKNLYREIRDISKDFCPVLGSSQCNGTVTWTDMKTQEAKFQHYIGMHQMDFSRSAKQAAAEFIITIGRDPDYPLTRYIHVPKNKLDGDGTGKSRNIKSEVTFDGQKSLYK